MSKNKYQEMTMEELRAEIICLCGSLGILIKGRKDLFGDCNVHPRRISLQLEMACKVFREKSVIEDREVKYE